MIIKVQQSLTSNESNPKVLAYNEDKSIIYEGELTKDVKRLMKRRPKAYFEAHMTNFKGEKVFEILNEVEKQNW